GSYDEAKGVNTPKVEGTGLIPVYHNGSTWVDLTENSTEEEWNNWYSYDTTNKKWANARTADGSMWVWIPRYEYKINSSAKTIDVNFIEGTSTATTAGYTLHPAFGTDINNGGWSSDIAGFWVAKYPAGWQNGTNGEESIGTPERTSKTYQTTSVNSTYDGNISTGKQMSYPVFKANTYAYNYITVGDMYTLSQDIKNASRYGLKNVDSHLQKNSEWGAVAYLAHSKYGVNGVDSVAQNTTNKGNTPTGVYAVTSTESVTNTSTTQNITGVYDMSGCVWEYTASFFQGGTTTYTTGMPTGSSSKYVTLYTANNKKGDATTETSGWNGDYANFVTSSHPVFLRGYNYSADSYAGLFAFNHISGHYNYVNGFRAVLVP
ncbi:MAG: SUMF1/EgtB/PvdO family nonheme iron enzyme, partial [Clostridia bacterium]|nr:SUMF1/EgtB/PvdO family nonheme iron enzyme [Clostridia bacterium]